MTDHHHARRRWRRGVALTALAVLTTATAGCGVPTSGPTTRVEEIPDDVTGPNETVMPLTPSTNAEKTVKAFLGAAAGDWSGRDDRLNVFVEEGAGHWSEPESGIVLIRVGDGDIDVADGATTTEAEVEVTGRIIGTYDTYGQVEPVKGDTDYHQRFSLRRDDASRSWSLKNPPEQVVLLDSTFAERYETRSVYFPATDDAAGTLVPDLRWMPTSVRNDQERYSQITDWLLDGPSDWLAGSVDSSFPRNTANKSVTVKNSRVTVDVSPQAAQQSAGPPSDMSAQLAWSLGLSDSTHLSLLVDGQERLSGPVSDWNYRSRAPSDDPAARNLSYFLTGDGAVAADHLDAPFVTGESLGLAAAVLEPHGDRIAGVTYRDSAARLVAGPPGTVARIDSFAAGVITDPQWFNRDRLLVLADGQPTLVKIADGKSRAIDIPDAPTGAISQLSLSPDSRRLAYVLNGRAWVVPITEVDGMTVEVGTPQRVGLDVEQVTDIGWSQETRLLMIGTVPDTEDWLWEVSIDNAYQQPLKGARDSIRADSLAVRCAYPKNTDEVGQPIIVLVGDELLRVFSDTVKAVTSRIDKQTEAPARGVMAPFTAP